MPKKTQKETVWKMLQDYGEIYNLWAFENGIWRLGAIIHKLRNEGKEIETDDSRKNCRYYLPVKETLF